MRITKHTPIGGTQNWLDTGTVMTLNDLMSAFLAQLGGKQTEINRKNYQTRLKFFLSSYGHKQPSEVTRDDINTWHTVITSRGYAPATCAGYRQAIKGFFNWLNRTCCHVLPIEACPHMCNQPLIGYSPASHLTVGSFISKRTSPIPKDIVETVYYTALVMSYEANPADVRASALVLLSIVSGGRSREIRSVRLTDIENTLNCGPDNAGIYRCASIGKTGEAILRFNRIVAGVIDRWLNLRPQARIDYLFTTLSQTVTSKDNQPRYRPLSRSNSNKCFVRVAKRAKVKTVFSQKWRWRLGNDTYKQFGAKVSATILNHADKETGLTAIAYYHQPDEDDISMAIASASDKLI